MGLRGGRREKLKFAVPTHPSGSADCFRWYRTGGLKPCLRLLVSKVLFKQSVWPLQPIANLMHKSTLDQGLDIGVWDACWTKFRRAPSRSKRNAGRRITSLDIRKHHHVLANAPEGMRVLYAILKSPGQLKQSERV